MRGFLLVFIVVLMVACQPKETTSEGKTKIVATTGMIADAIKNIVKDSAEVEALMGPGVDPHLYKATQGDLSKLTNADYIFYNGLYLEGKMEEIFPRLGRIKPVVAVAEVIAGERLRNSPIYQNAYDPHLWFDVSLWSEVVEFTLASLVELEPDNADYYNSNAKAYLTSLDSLHAAIKMELLKIPEEQRVLVTAHDAFGYFGQAYDVEVKGLQGLSTLTEFGLKDITDLVDFIISRKIKAVFIETSVSERAINAVVEGCQKKGWDVEIGGALYSDAMGEAGTFEGTYIGMVSANVKTIVGALK